ncbi:MAG: c-type cytochrome [Acidobacteria bacterium]|nr:c-type cytochrome [Acidobacteriota bacterium]
MRDLLRVTTLLVAAAAVCAQQAFNTSQDIEAGGRLFRAHCAACHGADGAAVRGTDLGRGQFHRGSSDQDLFRTISNGIPGTTMPPISLPGNQAWQIIAFVRSLGEWKAPAGATGDPRRGREIFDGKAGCLTCHRVDDKGGWAGPDLSEVGALRSWVQLESSVLRPAGTVRPQHWQVRAVARDGRTISGLRLNEDTHSLQLLDSQGRLVSLLKNDVQSYEIVKNSTMPSYEGKLTRQEADELVSYLVTLKGRNP